MRPMQPIAGTRANLGLGLIALAAIALGAANVRAAQQAASAPAPAPGAPRAAPATAAPGSCAACHGEVAKHTVVHPKVADCTSCHVPKTQEAHSFTVKTCASCHQMVKANDTFVHGPVAAGECLACHDPHGSDEPQQVRAFGSEICQRCHVDMKARLAEKRFTN